MDRIDHEIKRLEDQMEMDARLAVATSAPVHQDPKSGQRVAMVNRMERSVCVSL